MKVLAFLHYLDEVAQLSAVSVSRYKVALNHLLVWAGELHLREITEIRPSFPSFLASSRLDGRPGPLSPATAKKVVQVSKRFLRWAKLTYPGELASLPQLWIDSLKAPRIPEPPQDHEFVTLEEMKAIAGLRIRDGDLIMQRDRAAACLLYASGMRAGAFISLPIRALDLENRSVQQWPSLGVRTKMGKSATTYLLDIPYLLEPALEWDRHVRARLPETAMWYTPTVNAWGDQRLSAKPAGTGRVTTLGKRMRKLFAAAGLPYKSPHKFRHGHAVVALQHSRTMADYKAVSMNLMHSDIRVTDGIYAALAGQEVKRRISALTNGAADPIGSDSELNIAGPELSREEIAARLMDLARRLAA